MAEYTDPATMLRRIPYEGLTTFWRARYGRDLDGVDVAVYGVPFDASTSNRPLCTVRPVFDSRTVLL